MTHLPFFRWLREALLAVACLLAGSACRAEDARLGDYDFAYFFSGDAKASPVQVFDDGTNTFFQFRPGEPVPAIFVAPGGGLPQLVVPVQEGPYVRVPALHGRFVLKVGRAQALVVRGAAARMRAPAIDVIAADGARQPYTTVAAVPAGARLVAMLDPDSSRRGDERALDRNSYATPVKGDEVYWPQGSEQEESAISFARGSAVLSREAQRILAQVAGRAGHAARFTVIGRDDDSDKEGIERARAGAMRDALLKAGVATDRIKLRTGAMKAGGNDNSWLCTLLVDTRLAPPPMRPAPPRLQAVADSPERAAANSQLAAASPRTAASPPAATAPLPDVPVGGFTLSTADQTIAGAVRRWARVLHYEVVWDAPAPLDALIAGDATLPAHTLSEALDQLLHGLKEKGYALEVTLYANRVIRFTGAAASPQPAAPADRRAPVSRTAEAALFTGPH